MPSSAPQIHRYTILALAAALLFASTAALAQSRRPSALANVAPSDEAAATDPAQRVHRVTFDADGRQQTVAGRILLQASDGGLLLQTDDGTLWPIEGLSIVSRTETNAAFRPLDAKELSGRLLAELPDGFRVHTTPHYIVCYNTSRQYAEWVSSLFERLYKAFTAYWQRQGFELREPEFPLIVVAFADRAAYEVASRDELGNAAPNVVGYYSLKSNRVNMYDLTGAEAIRTAQSTARKGGAAAAPRRGSMREINQMLSRRAAVPLVATIVHEATHQIAFNGGLQTRLADIPLWQCEGMAMFFEAPDLASSRGWRGIGRVNYPRLETFRRNLSTGQPGRLESLLVDNNGFRDPRTAGAAYADAWALTYYLMKYRADDYAAYLQTLAAKPPLTEDTPDTRLTNFRTHFGNIEELEATFLKQMSRLD
jgi:hypothetical protein